MEGPVTLEQGHYGLRAVLTSSWSEKVAGFLQEKPIAELELNEGRGWVGNDLSFLRYFTDLVAFDILDFRIRSIESIHLLSKLRRLHISTYSNTKLRIHEFPDLEDLALEWPPEIEGLFDLAKLRKLWVNHYNRKDTDEFASLEPALESLSVWSAPVKNIRGVGELAHLRKLSLAHLRNLTSLSGIEKLTSLEELEIDSCRHIRSIDEIKTLVRLRKLWLNNDGDIDSLKPLNSLNCLRSVLFCDSTNIVDGDLSPLVRQNKLSNVSFRNRRHYSHRREYFGAAYFQGASWEKANS